MTADREPEGPRTFADPFGRAMRDFHRGEPGRLVYRDGTEVQDGNVEGFYFTPRAEWGEETTLELERLADARGPVVDVGCGTGQHVRWFQDRGVDAVGVDVSPNAVGTAREMGAERVLVGDMHDLPFEDGRFRAVHCVGTQLALGGSLAGIAALLREFARVTAEDAVGLVDNYDPTRLGADFFGFRPDPREGIAHRCFHFEYERARWEPGVRAVGPALHFLLCSPDRLRAAASETPWTVAAVRHTEPREIHYRARLERKPADGAGPDDRFSDRTTSDDRFSDRTTSDDRFSDRTTSDDRFSDRAGSDDEPSAAAIGARFFPVLVVRRGTE
ncbi:class I SAM-dependent methyltransferase [Halovivax sp.]|uniref:class I SAM-dependent methyltransferase n=1 Tax=Halovivax sp. TaxID=1935978 RepID=UPI00374385BC